jgi:hypothetical protein
LTAAGLLFTAAAVLRLPGSLHESWRIACIELDANQGNLRPLASRPAQAASIRRCPGLLFTFFAHGTILRKQEDDSSSQSIVMDI